MSKEITRPRGRPPGSKNKRTLVKEMMKGEASDLLFENLPKVMNAVIEQAMEGCRTSQKMILDRAMPAAKAIEVGTPDGGNEFTFTVRKLEETDIKRIKGDIIEGVAEEIE